MTVFNISTLFFLVYARTTIDLVSTDVQRQPATPVEGRLHLGDARRPESIDQHPVRLTAVPVVMRPRVIWRRDFMVAPGSHFGPSSHPVSMSGGTGPVGREGAGATDSIRHPSGVTMTLALIQGWGRQKYSNSPGWVKVYEKVSPWSKKPESNDPSTAVTVWSMLSLLAHVTVVPTDIRSSLTE